MSLLQKIVSVLLISGLFLVFLFGKSMNSLKTSNEPTLTTDTEPPTTVLVELFTSQGCSSCPPADRVLQKFTEEAAVDKLNIIALSYHVDYWNRLGWKDPYSQSTFSDRQRDYARHLPEQRVYTPQMVIQGRSSHVGSREREVRTAIRQAATRSAVTTIAATLQAPNEKTAARSISYQLTGRTANIVLHTALVATHLDNEVPRGENRGRHLAHTHVVLDLQTLTNPRDSGTIEFDLKVKENAQVSKVVLFVQDADTWEVLGVEGIEI